jgi:hypothetical protein
MAFQDSDLYKWLESVAYSLEAFPDAALEKLADGAIELIGAAQRPDGYVNTYYTIKEPDRRFKNLREGHELYCAGHLIEAAVAYRNATGKRRVFGYRRPLRRRMIRLVTARANSKDTPGIRGLSLL